MSKPRAATAVHRIPRRAVLQKESRLSRRVSFRTTEPFGIHSIKAEINFAAVFRMDGTCQLRLLIRSIGARLIYIEIGFARSLHPHQPLIARLVVGNLQLAAADAQDTVFSRTEFFTKLNATLDPRIVNIHTTNIQSILFSCHMNTIRTRGLHIPKSGFRPIMVDGSRFYRERAIQIERRFAWRPNAASKFSACPNLIDLHICMDIRFHRIFCIFIEPNAACRTAMLIGI